MWLVAVSARAIPMSRPLSRSDKPSNAPGNRETKSPEKMEPFSISVAHFRVETEDLGARGSRLQTAEFFHSD